MRIDPQLDATGMGINSRQHYFISAWLNLIHQYSLDSYRVRVMNPMNILMELRQMFDAHANDADRRVVAEEALEIFRDHPVIAATPASYPGHADLQLLLKEAVQAKENGFKKSQMLLMSFLREFEAALQQRFLGDCFAWMAANLVTSPPGEVVEERDRNYARIQRVARDLLSAAHGSGVSLASLFQLYRHFIPKEPVSPPVQPAGQPAEARGRPEEMLSQRDALAKNYDFTERFARVQSEILAAPKSHRVIFAISGVRKQDVAAVSGTFGAITISTTFPPDAGPVPNYAHKRFSPAAGRLFATAEVSGRDGRSAGLDAFRQVGQILDLMRFEYDTRAVEIDTQFLLRDGENLRLLELPQLIPNPEADPPTRRLEDFVVHLDQLADGMGLAEAKDRIFSAFRLYRVGTSVSMFENKLVNWWTGLEYLASGVKAGGNGIGPAVRDAVAPVLALTYLPKHLTAFRSALSGLEAEVFVDGQSRKVRDCTNVMLYHVFKDIAQRPALEAFCVGQPFLWSHLSTFMDHVSTPAKTASMLKVHDQRVRWQIERIYRARCDIVHAGGQVPMAGLLCANLEFYLRMTLKSMLKVFGDVPTLTGPAEFFERQRHQFVQVAGALTPPGNATGSDALLVQTMD